MLARGFQFSRFTSRVGGDSVGSLVCKTDMDTIAIKLEPGLLTNPDLDIRYTLSDLLAARCGKVIQDDGYDYVGSPATPASPMVIYLKASDLERAKACIIDVITNVHVLDNDLRRAATVAVQRGDKFEVIYPADGREEFVV